MFNVIKSRCHLVVKHQVSGTPNIKAYVAFRNSFLDSENFVPMTKCAFYIDQNNQDRGSTEFVFTAGRCTCGNANCNCGTHGGSIATIKIIATGSPVVIDSFAAVFNE